MNKQKLIDYAIGITFAAALGFAVLLTLPTGWFGKPIDTAQTIPWAVWRL